MSSWSYISGVSLLRISCVSETSYIFPERFLFKRLLSSWGAYSHLWVSPFMMQTLKGTEEDWKTLLCISILCPALVATGKRHRGTSHWHLWLLFPFLFFCYLPLFQGQADTFFSSLQYFSIPGRKVCWGLTAVVSSSPVDSFKFFYYSFPLVWQKYVFHQMW